MNNIKAKTGKDPKDFYDEAVRDGAMGPATKPMEFVSWLKARSGLGHGHAMAVLESFKRNGWYPVAAKSPPTAKRSSK
jgi:hypothetical protein